MIDAETVPDLVARASAAVEARQSYYVYGADPSLALAILGTVLYGIILLLHTLQVWNYRTWYFTPVIVACIMETLGYLTRTLSVKDKESQQNRGLFICQFALVVLAPVLIAAGDYVLFGKLLINTYGVGPKARSLFVPAKWVAPVFLTGDIISFILQGIGAGIMSGNSDGQDPEALKLGQNIMIAGLAVQLLFFGFFSVAALRFDWKSRKMTERPHTEMGRRWRWVLYALYASCMLIILRSAYRVAEFSEGWTGYLASHERYFWGLETLPMFVALALFNVIHPGQFLRPVKGSHSEDVSFEPADSHDVTEK